jgi:ceramide glucosyltransferase
VDELVAQCIFMASLVCYVAAALGCLYALVAAYAVRRFVAAASDSPAAVFPAVTILKPLHGAEPNLRDNLARFCVQDYPGEVQIVFGVSDRADPAIEVVADIVAAFPDRDLDLVVNSRRHGSNRKISNLINMAARARHEVLVISDSDIVVDADYLKNIVASLERPGVGLVTCLYRGVAARGARGASGASGASGARNVWAKLAAAAIDYHFLPSVLVGLLFGLAAPCFGSTIAIRKETLAAIGGLQAVADQLADDYALGAAVRRAGLGVAIPAYIVGHDCTQSSAPALFRHELRWARTIRSVDPLGYAGTAITHALPLALLGLLLGGMTPLAALVPVTFACRAVLQLELDRAFHLRKRFYWAGPLRDLVSFAIYVASFFGRGVEWRGHRYGVQADNTLAYYGEVET